MENNNFLLENLIKSYNGIYAIPDIDFVNSLQNKFTNVEKVKVRSSEIHNHRRNIYDNETKDKVFFIIKKLNEEENLGTIIKLVVSLKSSILIEIHLIEKLTPFSVIICEDFAEFSCISDRIEKFLLNNNNENYIKNLKGYKFIEKFHNYYNIT